MLCHGHIEARLSTAIHSCLGLLRVRGAVCFRFFQRRLRGSALAFPSSMHPVVADLVAFLNEHHGCVTELVAGMLDDPAEDSACVVWVACDACGARMVREA